MNSFFQKLSQADFLGYDEVAALPISKKQIIKMCITVPCKVNIRRGNLVYLVERKYKDKLSTYKASKVLKWLNINLPRLLPHPEEKYLQWKKNWHEKAKAEWMMRKLQAIDELPPLRTSVSSSESEENFEPTRMSGDETNSTEHTFNTVIQSQPINSQGTVSGFSGLLYASKDAIDSVELPPLFSNAVSSSERSLTEIDNNLEQGKGKPSQEKANFLLIAQSEEFSPEDDPYARFSLDNIVTSTQEFGF